MAKTKNYQPHKTMPTKKATRAKNLRIHCALHPNDAQSARHATHKKWVGFGG